jgi:hypothetical protein
VGAFGILIGMHKPNAYKWLVYSEKVPNLPVLVMKHQMSHVQPRPFARDRRQPEPPEEERRKWITRWLSAETLMYNVVTLLLIVCIVALLLFVVVDFQSLSPGAHNIPG